MNNLEAGSWHLYTIYTTADSTISTSHGAAITIADVAVAVNNATVNVDWGLDIIQTTDSAISVSERSTLLVSNISASLYRVTLITCVGRAGSLQVNGTVHLHTAHIS